MTIFLLIVLAAAAAAAAIIISRRRSSAEPSGWTAVTDGNDYGAVVDPISGSFDFPVAPNAIHYLTRACKRDEFKGAKGIRVRYRITADPGVTFIGAKDNQQVTEGPFLYLQRKGDDWSAAGQYNFYRWYATSHAEPFTPGDHDFTVLFTDHWNAVMTSDSVASPAQFLEALANAGRVGLVFPNHEGAGHGSYATGKAHFEFLGLDVI